MSTNKIRARVIGSGTKKDAFRVDLPTYQMIPGSEEYDSQDPKKLVAVEVLVPADECDSKGRPSKQKIRRKYKGQPRWDRPDVAADILAGNPGNNPLNGRSEASQAMTDASNPGHGVLTTMKRLIRKLWK